MNATESLLFNKIFIEFLDGVFSENETKKFEYDDIGKSLPEFYQIPELVKAGISFLLKQKVIFQLKEGGKDLYQISPEIIAKRKDEKENRELNEKIDLKIKNMTLNQLSWQKWQSKYWYFVIGGTIILTAFFSALFAWIFKSPS